MSDPIEAIHKAFMSFIKRAEKNSAQILYNTFVDTAPLFDMLSTKNNQVIYGRRGTGKTHALKYLEQYLRDVSEIPIYIDLRSVGSNGAIYHDPSRSVAERSVRLILDMLHVVADELCQIAVEQISDALHPEQITQRLDDFISAISSVKIVGVHSERERSALQTVKETRASVSLDTGDFSVDASAVHAHLQQCRRLTI